jgi:hypothetical protein
MPSTASIRDLRNRFPKVRKILESEGEVVLTEGGKARYRLTRYSEAAPKAPPPVDYWARLIAYQPKAISAEAIKALNKESRGDR